MLTTWLVIPAAEYITGRIVDLSLGGLPAAAWALGVVPAVTGFLGGSIPVASGFTPSLFTSLGGPVGAAAGAVAGAAGPVAMGGTAASIAGGLLSSLFRLFYGISAGLA
jgi:hypothetical protein